MFQLNFVATFSKFYIFVSFLKYTIEVFLVKVGTYEKEIITSINYLNKDWV